MNNLVYRAFLNLLMTSDPSPLSENQIALLKAYANQEAEKRGFANWVEAYHKLANEGDQSLIVLPPANGGPPITFVREHIVAWQRSHENPEHTLIKMRGGEVFSVSVKPSVLGELVGKYMEEP